MKNFLEYPKSSTLCRRSLGALLFLVLALNGCAKREDPNPQPAPGDSQDRQKSSPPGGSSSANDAENSKSQGASAADRGDGGFDDEDPKAQLGIVPDENRYTVNEIKALPEYDKFLKSTKTNESSSCEIVVDTANGLAQMDKRLVHVILGELQMNVDKILRLKPGKIQFGTHYKYRPGFPLQLMIPKMEGEYSRILYVFTQYLDLKVAISDKLGKSLFVKTDQFDMGNAGKLKASIEALNNLFTQMGQSFSRFIVGRTYLCFPAADTLVVPFGIDDLEFANFQKRCEQRVLAHKQWPLRMTFLVEENDQIEQAVDSLMDRVATVAQEIEVLSLSTSVAPYTIRLMGDQSERLEYDFKGSLGVHLRTDVQIGDLRTLMSQLKQYNSIEKNLGLRPEVEVSSGKRLSLAEKGRILGVLERVAEKIRLGGFDLDYIGISPINKQIETDCCSPRKLVVSYLSTEDEILQKLFDEKGQPRPLQKEEAEEESGQDVAEVLPE